MPVLTTVIDDKSPLIVYDATWLPGSAWDDPLASNYYLATFTTNNVTGGSVTFNFNGTAIWIYGAKRTNHGSYTVEIDSATYTNLNGDGNNIFQQSLFNTSTLSQEMHIAKLTNTATGNLYVDVDMIAWQSEIGNADDQLVTEVVQDTDSRFQYQEPAWISTSSTSNIDLNLFNNGSGHITQTYEASVTFVFTVGFFSFKDIITEAVSLFGTSGPSNGQYSVQLDGGQTVTYNATNAYPTNYGVVIYHADNLGSGSHQIVLTNLPAISDQILAVDYAQLWTTANTTTSSTTGLESSTSNDKLSPGAIAGIAIAAALAVLSAGAAIFFYRRWRAALVTYHDLYRIYTPPERPPASTTVAPTGFSSSLETRTNASLLRNDNATPAFSGGAQQAANNHGAQYDGAIQIPSGSRDSRSFVDTVGSPTQSPVDEGLGRRPLPDAPGGGLPLSTEFPKLAGSRRGQSIMATDRNSIAASDVPPPNYSQATGNRTPVHEL